MLHEIVKSSSLATSDRDAKIRRYCAASAAAGLVGVVTTADASVVFVNYSQTLADTNTADTSFTLFNFDLNNDGVVDFQLGQRIGPTATNPAVTGGAAFFNPNSPTHFLAVVGLTSGGYNYAARLAAGANIGGTTNNFIALTGTGFGQRARLVSQNGFSNSQWAAANGQTASGFLGIKFTIGGTQVNGYVQLSISDGQGATPRAITVIRAAYETSGDAITAGAVPEPSTTLGLLALGATGLMAHRRRAAKAA